MRIFYSLLVYMYGILLFLASFLHKKARLLVNGRKLTASLIKKPVDIHGCIWFHCASLGEFEQARPIIEGLKSNSVKIALSFYSPSGYEIQKNYSFTDVVFYLPLDVPGKMKRLVDWLQPSIVIFSKYDLWPNLLITLSKKGISSILISALLTKNSAFIAFSPYRKLIANLTHIFTQNQQTIEILNSYNINQTTLAGDTRVDRVIQIADEDFEDPIIERFCSGKNCLIAGSTWLPDEALLKKINGLIPELKLIIAPHDISPYHLNGISRLFGSDCAFYSSVKANHNTHRILIIDKIGLLNKIYRYGTFSYVGGGYGKGLHNTLEPAAYGLPVFFGNQNYHKFMEAVGLVQNGGAFAIKSEQEFYEQLMQFLKNSDKYREACNKVRQYISQSKGASKKILTHLEQIK